MNHGAVNEIPGRSGFESRRSPEQPREHELVDYAERDRWAAEDRHRRSPTRSSRSRMPAPRRERAGSSSVAMTLRVDQRTYGGPSNRLEDRVGDAISEAKRSAPPRRVARSAATGAGRRPFPRDERALQPSRAGARSTRGRRDRRRARVRVVNGGSGGGPWRRSNAGYAGSSRWRSKRKCAVRRMDQRGVGTSRNASWNIGSAWCHA